MERITLTVAGRGRLTAEASVFDGIATIRLDCDRDSAFWAEVRLTVADLEALLAEARRPECVCPHGAPILTCPACAD